MVKPKVLLAGETWITQSTHIKGVDSFTTSTLESGAGEFISALTDDGFCEVNHLMGHDVPQRFPDSMSDLGRYDVVILSDIGSRSILLHPDTWTKSLPTVNRLSLLRDWVLAGGGLGMIGGYLSFQGLDGAARYADSPLADILPAIMSQGDDCVEVPEGAEPRVTTEHAIVHGMPAPWPKLLGYNRLRPREGATVACTIGDDPLLCIGSAGKGRVLAWASDMGPHWCPPTFTHWAGYSTLWRRSITWLSQAR